MGSHTFYLADLKREKILGIHVQERQPVLVIDLNDKYPYDFDFAWKPYAGG